MFIRPLYRQLNCGLKNRLFLVRRQAYSTADAGSKSSFLQTVLLNTFFGSSAMLLGYIVYNEFGEKMGIAPTMLNDSQRKHKAHPDLQPPEFYQKVGTEIANLLESNPKYDDGSYGPLFVRLAWHAAGTFDKKTGTGGSNGATMRFKPESTDGANAGLGLARDLLEKIKKKHPEISYADLWTLAGCVAIKEMGGPTIPWRPGRVDLDTAAVDAKTVPPNGRLPDALKKADHLRDVFYRMGFNDQEIVALSGAHALGRCHTDRSGFTGPWTRAPTTFSNEYFKLLLSEKWQEKEWKGPKQFEDAKSKELMMLVSDLALLEDESFKQYVNLYAKDEDIFFKDFAKAFKKLLELGVNFPVDSPALSKY